MRERFFAACSSASSRLASHPVLVGGEGFAVDASLIQADANKQLGQGLALLARHEMNIQIVRNSGFDLIEKLAELGGAMASIALADDASDCDVEGGEQRCGAMALIIVAASRRLARPHR